MRVLRRIGTGSHNITYKTPICVGVRLELDVGSKEKSEYRIFEFARQKKSIKSARSTVEPRTICREAQRMADDRNAVLPIISYQSFSRVSNQKREKWENPFSDDYSRIVGYVDCLEEADNDKMLTNWYRRMEQVAWQQEKIILEYEIVKKPYPNSCSLCKTMRESIYSMISVRTNCYIRMKKKSCLSVY